MKLVASLIMLSLPLAVEAQQNCTTFNNYYGPYNKYQPDYRQHNSGNHYWINVTKGTCTYVGSALTYSPSSCYGHAQANSSSVASETGSTAPYWHQTGVKDAQGQADAYGATMNVDAEGAVGVSSCFGLPCGMSVNLSGNGYGGGFSISYNPSPYWADSVHYGLQCPGHVLPATGVCSPNGTSPPYTLYYPQYWSWDQTSCSYVVTTIPDHTSPVVVDTKNNGFQFSDVKKGDYVTFDLKGNGKPLKLSWPRQGSGDMWLVLPDENGQVRTGQQLFGNYTPHSDGGVKNHPNPNGFLALAWYDAPDQGGDGNLILDPSDKIWEQLRLWDASRCLKEKDTACVSQPDELYTLQSKGVYSISLVWDSVEKMPAKTKVATNKDGSLAYGPLGGLMDEVGNQYKYKALINPEAAKLPTDDKIHSCCDLHRKSRDGRWAIDVYLQTAK